MTSALVEMGGRFVQPFCFKDPSGSRTSHHLIFVTKNFKGYEIMKPIMAKESTRFAQGVPSFIYNPNDIVNPPLLNLDRPLDELEKLLLADFAGRRLTMRQIYEQHSVGRPYISRNYKDALLHLEARNVIMTRPSADCRRKNTFADSVEVIFPAH